MDDEKLKGALRHILKRRWNFFVMVLNNSEGLVQGSPTFLLLLVILINVKTLIHLMSSQKKNWASTSLDKINFSPIKSSHCDCIIPLLCCAGGCFGFFFCAIEGGFCCRAESVFQSASP